MGADYFDVAYINFDKAILHGRREDGSSVERVLTVEERQAIGEMRERQGLEMDDLLRRLAND